MAGCEQNVGEAAARVKGVKVGRERAGQTEQSRVLSPLPPAVCVLMYHHRASPVPHFPPTGDRRGPCLPCSG